MKLSRSHFDFWVEHQVTEPPTWAAPFTSVQRSTSVDRLINIQAGLRVETEPSNTISLLKAARSKGELYVRLYEFARYGAAPLSNGRRLAYCRRWLNKIQRQRIGLR